MNADNNFGLSCVVRDFATRHACEDELANRISVLLRDRLRHIPSVSLALSGGRTPRQVLPILAGMDVDWSAVNVTLTDDRCVSRSDPNSNARLIEKYFLAEGASAANFVPLWGETDQSEKMPRAIAAAKARLADFTWPLDVTYLGMGEDGHFASLFPAADVSQFGDENAVCVSGTAPQPPHQRISLSLPVILSSRHIFLHVTGTAKFEALKSALDMPPTPEFPISLLVHSGHPNFEILYAP